MASPAQAIRPEDLVKRYAGQWVISQTLSWDGTHDGWAAEPRYPARNVREKTTANDIDSLAKQHAAAGG